MEEVKTIIAEDVEITGSLKCNGGVKMAGKINGDLTCGGDVLVEKGAAIKGNVAAASIVVLGVIKGNVVAKDRIELKGQAKVSGDIKAKRLVVEEGVSLVGKSEISPSETGAAEPERVVETPAPKFEAFGAMEDDATKANPAAMRPAVDNRMRPGQLFGRK